MKIVIKSERTKMFIPVPIFLLPHILKIFKAICKKSTNNSESIKYIECLDVDSVRCIIKELKRYKGLKLVQVKSQDGTYVLIKV
ncbi:hypothetical protein [Clostridium sp. Marseille-Q2269]|uniref:hypothetical protein n=1 Tax=Clostridium sp. Marseille-Q2269 TaxID=2942205 RepID=UPI002074229C|nr:hypothetical protein [Clostridium sp. Marseille-Q2269]